MQESGINPNWPECLDLKQSSLYSGFSKWTLRGWVGSGEIPRVKVSNPYHPELCLRRIYILRKDLDEFIAKHRTNPQENNTKRPKDTREEK